MLDYAGGTLIAAIVIAVFASGAQLVVGGNGRARAEAIISGYALMLASAGFTVWDVLLR